MAVSRKKTAVWSGFLISAVFLYLALRRTDWASVLETLKRTNYLYLIPASLSFLADFSLRAVRWKFFLLHIKKCKYRNLLSSVFISFFSNTIFPMRAGEFIRSYFIGKQERISKVSALATIAAERVFDGMTVVGLLIFTLFFFPITPEVRRILTASLIFFAGVGVIFYGLLFFRDPTRRLIHSILKLFPKNIYKLGIKTVDSFIHGLSGIKSVQIIPIIILSILCWLLNASMFYFTGLGMGLGITFTGAIFLMAIVGLGVAIPSSPGYVGVFEFFGIMASEIIGIPRNDAVAYILLGRFLHTIIILSSGGFFMARAHMSLSQLEKQAEKETQ